MKEKLKTAGTAACFVAFAGCASLPPPHQADASVDRVARVRMMSLSGPTVLTFRQCGSADERPLAIHDPSKPKGAPFNQAPDLGMPRSEWSGGSDSQHRFAADVPVELRLRGRTPAGVNVATRSFGYSQCDISMALVPRAGVDYEVRFRFIEFDKICRVTINRLGPAQEEGRAVSLDLLPVDIPDRCGK